MITAAALCPAPPLLARELTGGDPVLPELRQACQAAAGALTSSRPDVIVVVGTGSATGIFDPAATLDLARYAPGLAVRAGAGGGRAVVADRPVTADGRTAGLPPALGLGALLLDQAGYAGRRVLQAVAEDEPARACAALGTGLAAGQGRVALLVMADGSARRTLKAPGYLDERAVPFDDQVERALRDGDGDALLAVDAGLARELMASGRPGWHVLAGALRGTGWAARVRYAGDPFGIGYLVASLDITA
ncbi:MAG TPA: hypothetical protein VGG25_22515 [Streptosporangiaceae bacterium]|jgi:hypothetical protein